MAFAPLDAAYRMEGGQVVSTGWSPSKKEDQEPLGTSSASLVPEPLRKKQAVAMCAFESAWTKLADERGATLLHCIM